VAFLKMHTLELLFMQADNFLSYRHKIKATGIGDFYPKHLKMIQELILFAVQEEVFTFSSCYKNLIAG
jgi:hypothetical protein